MKLLFSCVLFVLFVFNNCGANFNEFAYFDENSCLSRLPDILSTTYASNPAPFEIKLNKHDYSINENQPLVFSIEPKNNAIKIDSFMVQAVLDDDKLNKVVGYWRMPSSGLLKNAVRTLDCNSARDTLIEYGLDDLHDARFEWQLDDPGQIDNDHSSVVFIATVVGDDKQYWSNIKSDKIKLVKPDSLRIESIGDSKLDLTLDAEPIRVVSKRDYSKHFELSTSQCGSRRNCYVSLRTCDTDPKTCHYVLSWDYDGELINYELSAITAGWAGVIFSQDEYIGDDNIIACIKDIHSDRVDVVHYYKNTSYSDLIRLTENEDNLRKQYGAYSNDGFIFCKFSRPKQSNNRLIADLSKPHFIHVERGLPSELIANKLNSKFEKEPRFPSESLVDFTVTAYRKPNPRSWLVKVHAILGIIAWIFLGSIGILLARYYKPLWPNHVMYSFRVWFSFHRPIMVFVTLLTILSLFFALIEMDWRWSIDGNELLHAILGIIVVVCSCINPILGFFRPKPDSKMRCLFFWCHWLVGTIAYCLAVPTIFIGMDLSKSDIPNWCAWLLFAWVIFHIIVEIILEVHYCCTFYRLQGNYSEYNYDYDKNKKLTKKNKNPPGYRWKPTLLFVYAIVTAIVVSALIIAIVLFDV